MGGGINFSCYTGLWRGGVEVGGYRLYAAGQAGTLTGSDKVRLCPPQGALSLGQIKELFPHFYTFGGLSSMLLHKLGHGGKPPS